MSVNATPIAEDVLLTFQTPNEGLPALKSDGTTALDVALQVVTSIANPVVKYSFDLNGDGVTDLECSSPPTITASFQNAGIYLPTVTVTDSQGNTFTDTTIVNVLDDNDDSMFKIIWNRTKTALANKDVEGALNNFTEGAKDMFRYNFELMQEHLPEVSAGMSDITKVKREEGHAEFELLRTEEAGVRSYYIEYVKDADGVWRLSFF